MAKQREEWTLWGKHAMLAGGDTYVRLEQGSLTECRREGRYRSGLGGYTLSLLARGIDPNTLQPWEVSV